MKIPYTYVLLIKINLAHSLLCFTYANSLIDVLYQALSQCDLSYPSSCSSFHYHLLKASQAYPLVRSFKASLLFGPLFLVCLFVCFVCLCRWLMRVEWTWFESLEEYEDEEFWATSILWLKASVSLCFCPSNLINHYCICLALIWWVLLRIA
jgi:hypothetical protein